jgi:hypothetical protein
VTVFEHRNEKMALTLLVTLVALVGCGGNGNEDAAAAGAGAEGGAAAVAAGAPAANAGAGGTDDSGARTLPIPGSEGSGDLPPGHPPIGDTQLPPVDAAADSTLRWAAPESWIVEQPSSNMRFAQYRVPGSGGDAECVVFYFGPGQGGDPQANAMRWAGQFSQPDGSSSVEKMKTSELDANGTSVLLVEVTGTYDGGMTGSMEPATPKPDSMLLGAVAPGPDAPWFFKFTGPEATVRENREAFEQMMKSVR